MVVEGGIWSSDSNSLLLSDAIRSPLPPVLLRWRLKQDEDRLAPGMVSHRREC